MSRIKATIIGSGNIGTDLMMKMVKYPRNMELVAVVGIDAASEGLALARERGVATTHEGLAGLRAMAACPEIGILVELGRRKMVGGQDDMIVDVALDMLKSREGVTA